MSTNSNAAQLLSTHQVAKHLGVDMTTVIKWCSQEKLPSYKTPGGHRRIRVEELISFLKKYDMPIPQSLQNDFQFKVLVVDDEAPIRKIIKRTIESINKKIVVEEAGDGFTAGEKVASLKPNILFLDVNLPGLDGFEVCKRIRSHPNFKDIYVISISGRATEENKQRMLESGANEFIAKPLDMDQIKEKIKSLLPK